MENNRYNLEGILTVNQVIAIKDITQRIYTICDVKVMLDRPCEAP